MHLMKAIAGTLALAACSALAPSASAQTLQVLTAGSSAQFGPFAVGAYALAEKNGAAAFHYTVKSGSCAAGSTTCYASLNDTARSSSIPLEPGNMWVVWSTNGIWAYVSVDSTVGVRNFMATPRATLSLAAQASLPLSATSNYLFWSDGTPDTALTTTVYDALNAVQLTAANTDIRPEDALYATNRALNTLGYGSVADTRSGHSGQFLIGNPIISEFTPTAEANPVSFALGGDDPFSGQPEPTTIETFPIGAAPIVFLANTMSGSNLVNASEITPSNAALLFSGTGDCHSYLVKGATSGNSISPILREPLSGTMNTTEFTVFQANGGASQETGVSATANNPLDQACGANGFRERAVGTGDEVKAVYSHANALGYAFFSYESVNSGGATPLAYRYLMLNDIDPINASYTNGTLPYCPTTSGAYNCPIAGGKSFPNLRSGAYSAWSIYRMITDSSVTLPNGTSAATNVANLISKTKALVNSNIPDFVPFTPECTASTKGTNDPGLTIYREHFIPSTIETIPNTITVVPNDGSLAKNNITCTVVKASLPNLTLGGGHEAGGDVGGVVEGPFTASNPPTYPGPTESQPH